MLRVGDKDNLNIHTPLTFQGGERKNCKKVGGGNHRGDVPALVRWENRFGAQSCQSYSSSGPPLAGTAGA